MGAERFILGCKIKVGGFMRIVRVGANRFLYLCHTYSEKVLSLFVKDVLYTKTHYVGMCFVVESTLKS